MSAGLRGVDAKMSWADLAGMASLPAKAFQFLALAASELLLSGRYIVTGLSVNNSATVGGLLTVHDGQDANGVIVAEQGFAASSTNSQIVGTNGVLCESGVFLELAGGLVSGCIWAVPLWTYNITAPGT